MRQLHAFEMYVLMNLVWIIFVIISHSHTCSVRTSQLHRCYTCSLRSPLHKRKDLRFLFYISLITCDLASTFKFSDYILAHNRSFDDSSSECVVSRLTLIIDTLASWQSMVWDRIGTLERWALYCLWCIFHPTCGFLAMQLIWWHFHWQSAIVNFLSITYDKLGVCSFVLLRMTFSEL